MKIITHEQHMAEDRFAGWYIMLPSAVVGAAALGGQILLPKSITDTYFNVYDLLVFELGAITIFVAGAFWANKAHNACETTNR